MGRFFSILVILLCATLSWTHFLDPIGTNPKVPEGRACGEDGPYHSELC